MRRHTTIESTLGPLTLVADGEALAGVYFARHAHRPPVASFGAQVDTGADGLLREVARQFTEYLDGERREFDVPTATRGDEFHERVWALLREIAYADTTSYGRLAQQLGDVSLAQAVGKAVGENPLSVIVPCHRVVGSDGKLTGYAGGLARKRYLLDLETRVAYPDTMGALVVLEPPA